MLLFVKNRNLESQILIKRKSRITLAIRPSEFKILTTLFIQTTLSKYLLLLKIYYLVTIITIKNVIIQMKGTTLDMAFV